MSIAEKVAYLKGLMEGLDIDTDSKEGKVLFAVADVLGDIAEEMEDLAEYTDELAAQVDEIDEDLGDLEEEWYDDCDDDDCDCDCGCDCGCEDDDDVFYEVTCSSCGKSFEVDEQTLLDGDVCCPNCGEELEIGVEDEDGDETEE